LSETPARFEWNQTLPATPHCGMFLMYAVNPGIELMRSEVDAA
jgi:hypothetical protein